VPLFGALTSTKFSPTLQGPLPERVWIYKVDRQRRVVIYQALDSDYTVELPLTPFHGTVGVAPAAGEARNVLVPEAFGGNMDSPEAKAGSTNLPGRKLHSPGQVSQTISPERRSQLQTLVGVPPGFTQL
jgi:acetamidase/formamidase